MEIRRGGLLGWVPFPIPVIVSPKVIPIVNPMVNAIVNPTVDPIVNPTSIKSYTECYSKS